MKKLLTLAVLSVALTSLSASAEGVMGFVYKNAVEAGTGSSSVAATKVGSATSKSYFGIVALGNSSITTAMKNGKICSLAYYDVATKNILGYKKVTTRAYGQ